MISLYLFPLLLLLLSIGLIFWNVQSWRRAQAESDDARELAYSRGQFRRRIQASGLLALIAVSMLLGQTIPKARYPSLYVLVWFGVLLLLLWAVLLAIGDMVVNRQRLAQFQRERQIEQARLLVELNRLRNQSPERNGSSDSESDT